MRSERIKMGAYCDSLWRGMTPETLLKAEYEAFVYCGVDPATMQQKDCFLDGNPGSENYIHYVHFTSKKTDAKKLVLIHGFGGGTAQYMRFVPLLQDYFEVYALDLLGMGSSGRPIIKASAYTQPQAIDFFTDSLRAFFDQTKLALDPFILLGHSFGGLISGEYALKYPHQISQLVLMSPLGMPPMPDYRNFEKITADINENGSWLAKQGLKEAGGIWYGHPSPFEGIRMMGRFGEKFLLAGLTRRIPNIDDTMRKTLVHYLH